MTTSDSAAPSSVHEGHGSVARDDAAHAARPGHHGVDSSGAQEDDPTSHHGGHGDHAAMFRGKFWLSLALTVPVVLYSHMLMVLTGWNPPGFRRPLDPGGTGHSDVPLRLSGVPGRGLGRSPQSAARDDAAHLHGPTGGLRRLGGHDRGAHRRRSLARTGHPGHHHAVGPLAGDGGFGPGAGSWPPSRLSCPTRPNGSAMTARRRSPWANCVPVTSSSCGPAPESQPTEWWSTGRLKSTSR